MVCDLSWLYSLSLLSLGITLIVIGVAYALGQLLSNPQFNVWAKTEIFQVFISFFVVILVLYINGSFCDFKYSSIAALSPGGMPSYSYPEISGDDNVMNASGKYLANVAYFSDTEMRAGRAIYGVMDEASRYMRMPCMPALGMCMLGQNGYNVRPFSGYSSWLQALGFSLYTDTASYLTLIAQMCLLAFASGGGIMIYLPFAIIMRSLPMMRQFGGGLLAICIALFLVFPGLLVVESLFWNPYDMLGAADWSTLSDTAGRIGNGYYEFAVDYGNLIVGASGSGFMVWGPIGAIVVPIAVGIATAIIQGAVSYSNPWDYASLEAALGVVFKAASISFLSATFLFTLNIIAIGASARELGRLLGQEVDLSRLMQVV